MNTTTQPLAAQHAQASAFRRVLVGIDASPESLDAARQAATLATGPLTLLAAYRLTSAVIGAGMAPAPVYVDEASVRKPAEDALARVRQELGIPEHAAKIVRRAAWEALLDEIASENSTLVAVGSHGAGRVKGILIGSTATELVHKAPCSVLVARRPLTRFPSTIVVGVDGSKESAHAEAVAQGLTDRFGASLVRVENAAEPVDDLVDAAADADLLVVGSRGLRGVKALGSVSERVAHEAACSVLVVR